MTSLGELWTLKVIDLFSGLGGFSQAFVDRGHEVIRYDNNERFRNVPSTIIKDVLELTADDLQADIVLASPPCTHFSVASNHIHWPKGEPTEGTLKQIELVKHTIKIIKNANPKYWILENPMGMMRRVLGKPDYHTSWCAYGTLYKKPTDLWGNLPPIDRKQPMKWEKAPRGSKAGLLSHILRDPAKRALIPYDFSLAVCLAAEGLSQQRTLDVS